MGLVDSAHFTLARSGALLDFAKFSMSRMKSILHYLAFLAEGVLYSKRGRKFYSIWEKLYHDRPRFFCFLSSCPVVCGDKGGGGGV